MNSGAIFLNNLETILKYSFGGVINRRRLESFGDECGDVAAGPGLNEVFYITGASHFAIGIFQVQRAR